MEIKNEFYISLQETDREYFNVLFIEQNDERTNIPNAGEYNKALFDFISLQKYKATIDLSYICFHEAYNFTNHDLELNKIFEMVGFLNRFQKDGKASGNIIKRISFANAKFYKQVEFIRVDFEKQISFEGAYFYDNASFQESTFKEDVEGIEEKKRGTIFEGVRFHKEAIFQETEFQDQAKFFRVRFNEYTSFERAVFKKLIEFENFISKDLFYFHNVTIGKINLIGSDIERANFINLKSIDSKKPALTKENFANKDSVRLIKHHFESQNNITEANKYFAIEQDFFLDSLGEEDSPEPNKLINRISIWFNKYVSYYGTDWVLPLLLSSVFAFFASLVYAWLVGVPDCPGYTVFLPNEMTILLYEFCVAILLYILYYNLTYSGWCPGIWFLFFLLLVACVAMHFIYTPLFELNNRTVALINPLNIFSESLLYIKPQFFERINDFKDIALYGVFVKFVTATLMYQFIAAIRHNTRRQ